jgi:ABC-2 type transport system permease protein
MAFSWKRMQAVFWKDTLDLLKNRGLLLSMLVLPLVLVVVPTGVVYAYVINPDEPSLRLMARFYDPQLPSTVNAAQFLVERSLADWFSLYLLMPVFVPVLISSQSVAGEKERRTLEPLLASPVTAAELLAGKSLTSLVPAMLVTVGAFAALCVTVNVACWPLFHAPILPNRMWLFGIFVVAPLFAFFGNAVAVVVSARVGEARMAQQISGVLMLPLIGLFGSQVAGYLQAGTQYYAVLAAVVGLLDVVLVWVGIRLFDRERLVSRWV